MPENQDREFPQGFPLIVNAGQLDINYLAFFFLAVEYEFFTNS